MQKDWGLDPSFIHLNHAAVGPWPLRTSQAISAFAKENAEQGSWHYPQWLKTEMALRQNFCHMLNASSKDSIALVKNTSEALSFVAYGLPFKNGDNIVISNQEFPSNRIVWDSLGSKGVQLKEVDLYSQQSPEQALMDACDQNTRLLSISSVQYATGLKIDLATLGAFCRQNDILFCVDAIQSIGAEPMDVQSCSIDFLAADGHKWLLAPEGLGVFYCHPDAMEKLSLTQFGWHMVEKIGDYTTKEWQVADTARRFECGSPNMLGIHALHASTSLLLEVGMEKVAQLIHEKVSFLIAELQSIPHISVISSLVPERRLGILTFSSSKIPPEELFEILTKQRIFCALRGGGIRLSPHYYTPQSQLEAVIRIVNSV